MRWIKENIESFGGNPTQITLFGESAGAASIVAHMIAPGSRDLFRNGILQSGSLDNKWSLESPKRALEKSHKLAKSLNCWKDQVNIAISFYYISNSTLFYLLLSSCIFDHFMNFNEFNIL